MKSTAAARVHVSIATAPVTTAAAASRVAPASKAGSSQRAVARLAPTAAGTAAAGLAEALTELHSEPAQCVGLAMTALSEAGGGLLEMAPVESVCHQGPLGTSSVPQDLHCQGSGQHNL